MASQLTVDASTGWRARLACALERPRVAHAVIALIVVNAIVLGLETVPGLSAGALRLLQAIDQALLVVFVVELALKLVAHGGRFFREQWNVFDFAVIAIALVPASEGLAVLRALRILRALRLISMVPSMRKVVTALLTALPGMGSIVALLALVMYVAAVMATKLFHDAAPEFFGSLGASLFTLFQIMTVEGWPDIARQVIAVEPWAWVFFVVYLVTATFTVLNLFIAVIVNAMQEQVAAEHAHIDRVEQADRVRDDAMLQEIRALRAELGELRARLGATVSA
ncbi:MAG TPA: ion transporter [Lysobacter sp.]|nr:ion transporter [Lysobacter sp.]